MEQSTPKLFLIQYVQQRLYCIFQHAASEELLDEFNAESEKKKAPTAAKFVLPFASQNGFVSTDETLLSFL
jgi:hypothetical protein